MHNQRITDPHQHHHQGMRTGRIPWKNNARWKLFQPWYASACERTKNHPSNPRGCHARGISRARTHAVREDQPPVPRNTEENTELDKNYHAKQVESKLYERWEKNGLFAPHNVGQTDQPPFVMCMPPPNVTGKLHMGHAMFVTLQDIMARYARMKGRPTLWLPGTDHAGIATQLVVEKMMAEQGIRRTDMKREEFVEKVWEWKRQYGGFITQQLRRMGASCDWSRERFTLDARLSEAVAEAFVRLDEKGLIYRGSYMVNWSPHLQTAVSDLEVEYRDEEGTLYFFNYPIVGSEESLQIATTRPETILGDTAIAVHPEDDRYRHLVGERAVVPMSDGRQIPIIADEYVDPEFGTGALKITPGHDPNDYALGKKFDLEIISIMNKDGTMNENAASYAGLTREECRSQLWKDMDKAGLAVRTEKHTNRVPRSQRGGEVIEPMVSEQWFVRMEELAKPALDAVHKGEVRIVPERFEKVYFNWLTGIKDWCISRQLWWGHRIPVWYVYSTAEMAETSIGTTHSGRPYVVARNEQEAFEKARRTHGDGVYLVQETDVLDTWFSSGLWPFSTLGWPDVDDPDFKAFYPTQMLETGHDILFFWVARMMMMGIELTGKAPFDTIFLHGLVRDEEGRKMSKSLGNVIDPLDVVDEYGADALRFSLATGTTPGQDINLSMSRVEANRNLSTKLWNAGKFVLSNVKGLSNEELSALVARKFDTSASLADLPLAERWIVSSLHMLVDHVSECNDRHDFGESGRALYDFFWGEFADWYIESSKSRLYGGDAEAAMVSRTVLVYCFHELLKLWHPFMPFVTEELWNAFPFEGESLMVDRWPESDLPRDGTSVAQYDVLKASVRSIRNARSEYNVEPRRKIPACVVIEDGSLCRELMKEHDVVASLSRVDPARLEFVHQPPEGADDGSWVQLVVGDGVEVFLPLAGLADPAKEMARLEKQAGKLDKELAACMGRLGSSSFLEKAPEAVVEKVKAEKQEVEEKLKAVSGRLALMKELLDKQMA
eukprot:scaffold1645_cov288-Pavlova_lutheri.AAC.15